MSGTTLKTGSCNEWLFFFIQNFFAHPFKRDRDTERPLRQRYFGLQIPSDSLIWCFENYPWTILARSFKYKPKAIDLDQKGGTAVSMSWSPF